MITFQISYLIPYQQTCYLGIAKKRAFHFRREYLNSVWHHQWLKENFTLIFTFFNNSRYPEGTLLLPICHIKWLPVGKSGAKWTWAESKWHELNRNGSGKYLESDYYTPYSLWAISPHLITSLVIRETFGFIQSNLGIRQTLNSTLNLIWSQLKI